MRARRSQLLTFVVVMALAGCHDAPPPTGPQKFEKPGKRTEDVRATTPIWARRIQGIDDAGAQYMLLFPAVNWTGRLVLIVHPLVDPRKAIMLDSISPGVNTLGARGDAVAYSSFSENGWAVKDGAQRTHELRDLFTAHFGAPTRVYLYGQSMGSLIAINLAESFPTQYDGVVAECGILGGSLARFQYMLDVRSMFDFFYPGMLPGGTLSYPDDLPPERADTLARDAMLASMEGARQIAKIVQTPVPGISDAELRRALANQLFRHAREVNDIMVRGHGEPPVGNRNVTYTGDLDPATLAAINASVSRYDAGRYAAHYAEQYYEPTGRLRIPVVSLYTPRDMAQPQVLNQDLYQQRLASAGASAFFTQLASDVAFGHCSATLDFRVKAYDLLLHISEGTNAPGGG